MGTFLTKEDIAKLEPADVAAFHSPVPTQIVSNGEFDPLPQNDAQKKVEALLKDLADRLGRRAGQSRRQFLRTAGGMAAAFMAMNRIYGPVFEVSEAEAGEPERGEERARAFKSQFIFDDQLHFVHDDFDGGPVNDVLLKQFFGFAGEHWNPALKGQTRRLADLKFQNFLKEIFLDSDTRAGLISSAPFDSENLIVLNNGQMARARRVINAAAGSRRVLCHAIFTPGQPGWMDDVDRAIEEHKPDSWKGYTIGDPLGTSKFPWRLDDEKLVYPFYEKIVKAGMTTVCVHKGIVPSGYEKDHPELVRHATPQDVAKAAKDWPQIRFVIYHSAYRMGLELPDAMLAEFDRTGYIQWTSDLIRLVQKNDLRNVYAELGACFANCCITHPRLAAALVGSLVKGMGPDRIVWGTDSVWFGSPQWQIEAMRRLEIPEDMQKKQGFAPLGPGDSAVKNAIFGFNSAMLYNLNLQMAASPMEPDQLVRMKEAYEAEGPQRSNAAYGFVTRRTA